MNNDRLIIYHGQCGSGDGMTAAWAALKSPDWAGAETFPGSTSDFRPPDCTGKHVLIVDYAYSREVTEDIHTRAKSLLVLDHHDTHQKKLVGLPYCIFDMERSGAGLTWDTLHPGKPRPWICEYSQDVDLWRHKLPDTKAVNAWIQTVRRDGDFEAWDRLAAMSVEEVAALGRPILVWQERYIEKMIGQAIQVNRLGYTVPVVNAPYPFISELLARLAVGQAFAVGWYQDGAGMYKYSLRSAPDGENVGNIAQQFKDGGGHVHAAGFTSDSRIW